MNPNYFKANFKIAIKSKKNFLLVCLLVIFVPFFLFVVESQRIGDGSLQWRDYAESVQVNTDYFDGSSLRKKNYKKTYDNLNKQATYIAVIQNGEIFNDPQSYLKGSENLIKTMLDGYKNNYKGANTLNIPAKYELYQRLVSYKYLYRHHIPIVMNSKSSSTYLIYILSLVGLFIFLYVLFISSDVWMLKLNHSTVLKNIPYRIKDEVIGKININIALTIIPLLIGMLGAYLFAGIRNGFSNLKYPEVFYITRITAIPLWLYCLLFLLYSIVIVIFATSLTLFLNQITRNVYLSILIGMFVY
ncbi:MAG: ABC transporter permease, partial [Lactobacillus sp.]|nr:ABC transporter permease [Lactobacillus sp.]